MRACVVIGLGQLGRLLGGAALSCGYRTTPVLRGGPIDESLVDGRGPILVTVGERALADVLVSLPRERHDDVILVQNELFPDVWRATLGGNARPTVAVVWSNVKKDRPVEVGRATHVFGSYAQLVRELHNAAGVPCVELQSPMDLEQELVAKYGFIIAVNALGLEKARSVGEWLDADAARVDAALAQTIALGEARVGRPCPGAKAIARAAMEPLRAMPAAGRTAQERVTRARDIAKRLGVPFAL